MAKHPNLCKSRAPERTASFVTVAVIGLLVSAFGDCARGESGPPPPAPIQTGRAEARDVSMASVEALVASGVPAYEAWQVQRRGGLAMAVIVERFVRGECYERQIYTREDGSGLFAPDGPADKGRRRITPTTEQRSPDLLIGQATDRSLAEGAGIHVARHGLERPAWSFARVEAGDGGQPVELTTEFSYDLSGCGLPPRLDDSRVPPPRGSAPTVRVLARDAVSWGDTRERGHSYVRGLTRGSSD